LRKGIAIKELYRRDETQVKYASVALKKSCRIPKGCNTEQDELVFDPVE